MVPKCTQWPWRLQLRHEFGREALGLGEAELVRHHDQPDAGARDGSRRGSSRIADRRGDDHGGDASRLGPLDGEPQASPRCAPCPAARSRRSSLPLTPRLPSPRIVSRYSTVSTGACFHSTSSR